MVDRPLVSVVMIFKDARRYLGEAIASVFAQTYPSWELLLVDDGSSDGSEEMARSLAEADAARVHYLAHPNRENRGPSASRNLGTSHASGEYIAFLDSDDVWLPDKLKQQIAIFSAHPDVGMVYGRTLIWHSWTGRAEDRAGDCFYDLGVPADSVAHPPRLFLQLVENRAQTPTTCSAILRADLVRRVGGFDESFRRMYEDQEFFARISLRTSVYVAGACWAKYRQHPESMTSKDEGRIGYLRNRRRLLGRLERHAASTPWATDSELQRILRRESRAARHPYLHVLGQETRKLLRRIGGRGRNAGVATIHARSEPTEATD